MNSPKIFGTLPDGRPVHSVTITNGILTAEFLTWGAVLRDLRFAGFDHPLVLGLNSLDDYLEHSPNFGSTVGRVANRIFGGSFELDGQTYALECNDGFNCLHGGANGTSKALWHIEELRDDAVTMTMTDPAGNAGFPGDVKIRAEFSLQGGSLCVRYESTTNAATPVNIAHHAYFNLGGGVDIRDHHVQISADTCLEIGNQSGASLRRISVDGTDYDFRQSAEVGPRIQRTGGFDNNYCLSNESQAMRPVAILTAPNGLTMDMASTEPGLQLYTADKLNCAVPGLQERHYGANAGICFETQNWPDAVNQPDFPDAILRPDQKLIQETHFTFRKD